MACGVESLMSRAVVMPPAAATALVSSPMVVARAGAVRRMVRALDAEGTALMSPLWRIDGPGLRDRAAAAQNVAGITPRPRNDAGSVRYCCRMPVTTLTDDTFESAVTSAEAAVVVLTDAHCSTCGHYTTVVERVAEQMADEAEFYFVSHDSAPEVYASSGVRSVPVSYTHLRAHET